MKALSRKLLQTENGDLAHFCEPCQRLHIFTITGPRPWVWDGNVAAPTLNPSMLTIWEGVDRGGVECAQRCHYFLHAGQLLYCSDSAHPLAGVTVDLPDLPPQWLPDPT